MIFWPWYQTIVQSKWFIFIIPLILIAVIVWAIIRLAQPSARPTATHSPDKISQAVEILNVRLAKGDITEEEYERIKSRIMK
ncbi:MAG: SHOCT domain-containing protein [Clostridia bacterium]|nr:SHOCT domain-containing protein [Clostridia bacterium]